MAKIHSRYSAYVLLAITAAAMEAVFGWRASVMYEHYLAPYVGSIELWAFRIVVFLGVAVAGYVLATHRQFGVEATIDRIRSKHPIKAYADRAIWWATLAIFAGVGVVILHDWAGVVYTVFGTGTTPINGVTIVITLGMCAFVMLPFLLGHMMLALAEGIAQERENAYDRTIDRLDKRMKIDAAKELVEQASNMSPQERLQYGVKGYIEAPKEQARGLEYQAEQPSQNGKQDKTQSRK